MLDTNRVNLICELSQVVFLHYQTETIVLHDKKLKLERNQRKKEITQERNQT